MFIAVVEAKNGYGGLAWRMLAHPTGLTKLDTELRPYRVRGPASSSPGLGVPKHPRAARAFPSC